MHCSHRDLQWNALLRRDSSLLLFDVEDCSTYLAHVPLYVFLCANLQWPELDEDNLEALKLGDFLNLSVCFKCVAPRQANADNFGSFLSVLRLALRPKCPWHLVFSTLNWILPATLVVERANRILFGLYDRTRWSWLIRYELLSVAILRLHILIVGLFLKFAVEFVNSGIFMEKALLLLHWCKHIKWCISYSISSQLSLQEPEWDALNSCWWYIFAISGVCRRHSFDQEGMVLITLIFITLLDCFHLALYNLHRKLATGNHSPRHWYGHLFFLLIARGFWNRWFSTFLHDLLLSDCFFGTVRLDLRFDCPHFVVFYLLSHR